MFTPGTRGALAIEWSRRNLFGSVLNTVLTTIVVVLAVLIVPPLFRWSVTQASLLGATRADCTGDGACWTFIRVRLPLFFYGRYPDSEYWRVDLAGVLLVAFCIPASARSGSASLAVASAAAGAVSSAGVNAAVGRRVRSRLCRHHALGRVDARRHHLVRHRGRFAAARHTARARAAIAVADRARAVDRLHRVVARRAAAHRAVHVRGAGAAVPATGRVGRSAVARHGRARAVQCRLHGGGRARWTARCP